MKWNSLIRWQLPFVHAQSLMFAGKFAYSRIFIWSMNTFHSNKSPLASIYFILDTTYFKYFSSTKALFFSLIFLVIFHIVNVMILHWNAWTVQHHSVSMIKRERMCREHDEMCFRCQKNEIRQTSDVATEKKRGVRESDNKNATIEWLIQTIVMFLDFFSFVFCLFPILLRFPSRWNRWRLLNGDRNKTVTIVSREEWEIRWKYWQLTTTSAMAQSSCHGIWIVETRPEWFDSCDSHVANVLQYTIVSFSSDWIKVFVCVCNSKTISETLLLFIYPNVRRRFFLVASHQFVVIILCHRNTCFLHSTHLTNTFIHVTPFHYNTNEQYFLV